MSKKWKVIFSTDLRLCEEFWTRWERCVILIVKKLFKGRRRVILWKIWKCISKTYECVVLSWETVLFKCQMGQCEVYTDQSRFRSKPSKNIEKSIFHRAHRSSIKVVINTHLMSRSQSLKVLTSLQSDAKVEFVTQSLFIRSVWWD